MIDKLIKIKRSRYKQEELFLIDLFNASTSRENKNNIIWEKNNEICFIYSKKDKSLRYSRDLVFEPISNILVNTGVNIMFFIKTFFIENIESDVVFSYIID